MVLGGDADVTDRAPTGATTTDTGRARSSVGNDSMIAGSDHPLNPTLYRIS